MSELPGCNECNPQGYPEMIVPLITCPHGSVTKPNEPSMGDEEEEYELHRGHARDEFRRLKEELDEYKGLYDAEYCQRQAYVAEAVKAERERCLSAIDNSDSLTGARHKILNPPEARAGEEGEG